MGVRPPPQRGHHRLLSQQVLQLPEAGPQPLRPLVLQEPLVASPRREAGLVEGVGALCLGPGLRLVVVLVAAEVRVPDRRVGAQGEQVDVTLQNYTDMGCAGWGLN